MDTTDKQKLDEAGAFWIKKSKTGNQFLTGQIKTKSGEEIKVIVFKNKYKTEGSNQPDYRIYFDNNIQNKPVTTNSKSSTTQVESKPKAEKKQKEVTASEEIPF